MSRELYPTGTVFHFTNFGYMGGTSYISRRDNYVVDSYVVDSLTGVLDNLFYICRSPEHLESLCLESDLVNRLSSSVTQRTPTRYHYPGSG